MKLALGGAQFGLNYGFEKNNSNLIPNTPPISAT